MRIKDNIANEFGAFSANYTQDMINCVPHYQRLIEVFTQDLPSDFKPNTILDLGCGNGNVMAQLLKYFPTSKFTLLDASKEMLDICASRFNIDNVSYVCSYFKDYKFSKNSFDFVTAGFSLHHCDGEEKQLLFKLINRSLKPGGVFAFSDLVISKSNLEHGNLLKQWQDFVCGNYPDDEKWHWLMEHYDEFDKPDDLNAQLGWLHHAGFDTIKVTMYDQYWIHIKALNELA